MSFASNAVLSKARAMYGKRISIKNYDELLAFRNIPDIISYLKKKTLYSEVLKDINENDVHRSNVEERLKLKIFMDFETLGRYDISVGQHFCDYFISRAEIDQFLHTLLMICAGRPSEHIFPKYDFFYEHTKIDLKILKEARNYDDILNAVKKTKYYEIFYKFKPKNKEKINVSGLETSLCGYLYNVIFKIINKYVKGSAKKQLYSFFKLYIDLTNLVRITRMKKFYKLTDNYMMDLIIEGGTLKKDDLRKFIENPNNKQMMLDMKNTAMGKKWFSKNLDIIDKVPRNMRYNWCKHNIRFSTSPAVVLMSYVFLEEIEILNLISIIEGVKYRLPPEEIKKTLIL